MSIRLNGSTSGYVEIDAPAVAGSTSITLPATSGGEVVVTDSSGNIDLGPLDINGSAADDSVNIDASGRLLVGTIGAISTATTFESTKASGPNVAWINSEDLDDGDDAYIAARGEVNNANSRICRIGVIKLAGNTHACGYIFMDEEDGSNAYYWTDNSGNFRVSSSASNIGTTGGTVVGTQTSDERVKDILGPVEYGLETLKQIEPVRFSLKSQPHIEQLGFVAQQVQPLVPQSVFDTNEHIEGEPEDAPTKLGMEYVALIPVLVNAIKEMATKIETLEAINDSFEARLTALEGGQP